MSHKAVPTETFDRILSGLPAGGEAKDEPGEKKKSGGARKMFLRVSNAVRATSGGAKVAKEREKGKDRVEREDKREDEEDKDKGRKSGDDSGDDKGNRKVHFQ